MRTSYQRRLLATVLIADVGFGTTMTLLGAALGTVAEDLNTSETALAWTITAPFLAIAVGAPLFGRIGDVIGLRGVFRFGLGLFAAATFFSALAPSVGWLIGFRALAGIGASASLPTGMALLLREFPVSERSKVLGWFHMVATAGPVVGLVTGGFMIDWLGWESVFYFYGTFAAVGFLIAFVVIRPIPAQTEATVDVVGGLLLGATSLSFLIGLSSIERVGMANPQPYLFVGAAVVCLGAFLRVEAQVAEPLLPLEFLRRRNFTAPLVASAALNAAYLGGLVLSPLLLQDHFGYSVGVSSAMLLLRPGTFSLTSVLGGRLGDRIGPGRTATIGAASMMVSMSLFVFGSWLENLPLVLAGLLCTGASFGLYVPSATATLAGDMDDENYGVASGMLSTSGTLGGTIGLTMMILALGSTDPHPSSDFIIGYAPGIGFAAIGFLATLAIKRRDPESALVSGSDPTVAVQ